MMPGSGTTRAASLGTATFVVAGVTVLVTAGSLRAVLLATVGGALLGGVVLTGDADMPSSRAIAAALNPVTATLLVGSVGLAIVDSGAVAGLSDATGMTDLIAALVAPSVVQLCVAGGAGVAVFGAVGTLRDGIGDGAVRRVFGVTALTGLGTLIALAVVVIPRFDALSRLSVPTVDLSGVRAALLTPTDPRVGLLTFGVLLIAVALSIGRAVRVVPIVELAARRHRDRLRTHLTRIRSGLRWAIFVGIVLFTVGTGTLGADATVDPGTTPVLGIAVGVVTASAIRPILLAVIVAFLTVAFVGYLLNRVTGDVAGLIRFLLPPASGTAVVVSLAVAIGTQWGAMRSTLPPSALPVVAPIVGALSATGAVLLAAVAVLGAFGTGLALLVVLGATGMVPSRAGGAVIAGAGLVLGGIGVGVAGDRPIATVALIALGVVAWDVGERGVTARAELGAASGWRVAVVHVLGATTVAVVAVIVAHALRTIALRRIAIREMPLAAGGLLSIVLGVVVLLLFIRA